MASKISRTSKTKKATGRTAKTADKSNLSPSLNHRHIMSQLSQSHAWTGLAGAGEAASLKSWQSRLRRKLSELVGDMPAERVPLNVRSLWKREHPLGTIEKIVITTERYSDMPAFACIPHNAKPPYDWMICLQGHSTGMHNSIAVDRDENIHPVQVRGDRDFALGCMERGIAAIAIEQRCFGERREQVQKKIANHPCHDATMHALMLGRTMVGERVWDVDRTIDYLAARGDVNMKTLGVMGNSGGGTVSLFAAALLPRIKAAMPSCYFCTFRDSLMSIYHCADNYVPGLLKVAEMPDVMGLFAPKPVVLVAGKEDDIFPIKGVRAAFRRLKEIYTAAGAGDRCHLVVGPEGHRFYAEMAWPKMLKEIERLKG